MTSIAEYRIFNPEPYVDITSWKDWEASQLRAIGVKPLTLVREHY